MKNVVESIFGFKIKVKNNKESMVAVDHENIFHQQRTIGGSHRVYV